MGDKSISNAETVSETPGQESNMPTKNLLGDVQFKSKAATQNSRNTQDSPKKDNQQKGYGLWGGKWEWARSKRTTNVRSLVKTRKSKRTRRTRDFYQPKSFNIAGPKKSDTQKIKS